MIQELHCTCDNRKIFGLLYRPEKIIHKLPIVILCHGLYANHKWLIYYAEELLKENILSYVFDFCGGDMDSKSDGEIIDSSPLTQKRELNEIINTIQKLDIVDTSKIYLLGHSQGGLVATITANPNIINTLFLLAPAFNVPEEMSQITPPKEGHMTKILPGRVGRRYILDASSINIEKIIKEYDGKIIIFHGSKDYAVAIENSIRANENFKNSELIIINDEKHNFQKEAKQKVLHKIIETIKG